MKTTSSLIRMVLTLSIVSGFMAVLLKLIDHPGNEATVNLMCGALAGSFATAIAFYTGSNAGSDAKSETIAALAHKAMDKTPPRPGDAVAEQIKSPS